MSIDAHAHLLLSSGLKSCFQISFVPYLVARAKVPAVISFTRDAVTTVLPTPTCTMAIAPAFTYLLGGAVRYILDLGDARVDFRAGGCVTWDGQQNVLGAY